MKRTILLSAVSALLLGASVSPAAAYRSESFLPENDMNIPVDSPMARGITEAQFNKVLDIIQEIYNPIVAAKGAKLQINRKWTDGTVNAYAQQSGKTYIISMFGGLARHDAITMDGFALVACHEMGHHLGGAPKHSGWSSWASIEGQADYYANLKCLRMVYTHPGSKEFTGMLSTGDELAQKNCDETFDNPDDKALCVRNAMSGKSVARLFMALTNSTVEPSFDTPDPKVVTTMLTSHPPTQCRLDTYLQGSLCTQPVSAGVSDSDVSAGTCTRSAGFKTGFRPLCWYKPAKDTEMLAPGVPEFGATVNSPAFSVLRTGLGW